MYKTIVTLFALAAVSPGAWSAPGDLTLRMQDERSHRFHGWGITLSEVDWDDTSVLISDSIRTKLVRDLSLPIVRIMLPVLAPPDARDEAEEGRPTTEMGLINHLRDLVSDGVSRYVLTVRTPARGMKNLITKNGGWFGNPVSLRTDMEALFLQGACAQIAAIQEAGLPLPLAFSIQTEPDFANSASPGCYYSPEQWQRLTRLLRQQLDKQGFTTVAIAGPETTNARKAFTFLAGPASAIDAGALCVQAMTFGDSDAATDCFDQGLSLAAFARQSQRPIWILDAKVALAADDNSQLINAFKLLHRDLISYKANYWFWSRGFAVDACAEALLHGEAGRPSPLFAALCRLWARSAEGADVHSIEGTDQDTLGFALITVGSAILIVVNHGSEPKTLTIKQRLAAAITYAHSPNPTAVPLVEEGESVRCTIPPLSVTYLTTAPHP